ncbi:polyprenyl synthetase family protein [Sphingomicrobium maritimum]|uniref:polyprenyl synthetase family protein n=1 Tax=Sphingomicrobium maritimum TaxID=3133972 RepID=UPI003D769EB0
MQAERVVAPDLMAEARAAAKDVDALFAALLASPGDSRDPLYEAMRHAAIDGGKRMRPLLVRAAGRLFNLSDERVLRVGAAIEAIHVYSLIHDDLPCMDDDDLRRGKPTLHKAYDEAIAVLAGDSLHDLAFALLAHEATHPEAQVRVDLIAELAKAAGPDGMAGGQVMDLEAEKAEPLDLDSITRLQQLKTGALIEYAVEAACILGQVGEGLRIPYRGYARNVGLAFQIADDLLDVDGDETKAGKRLKKDEDAGKATFVSLMGEQRAREQAAMLVEQANEHLAHHGGEADLLRAIARYSIERDR